MTNTVLWSGLVVVLLTFPVAGFVYARRRGSRAVARATFLATQAAGIPSFRCLLQQLSAELDRTRRYGRRLMILVLKLQIPEGEDAAAEGRNGNRAHQLIHKLLLNASFVSYVLRDALRTSDLVSYDPDLDHFVIVLPEAEKPQAERFLHRQTQRSWELLGVRLQVGMAEFPANGLTLEELVQSACAQCLEHDSTPAFRVAEAARVGSTVPKRELA